MTWLLVAEDSEDLREMLADALRGHGYEVHTAGDGAEVVQMLDAAAEMPAVVLLDLVMPRVSGREVLRAMRSVGRARHVPVVLITGLELSEADINRLRRHRGTAEACPCRASVRRNRQGV
jgi:CheY-like chemotaxis protein